MVSSLDYLLNQADALRDFNQRFFIQRPPEMERRVCIRVRPCQRRVSSLRTLSECDGNAARFNLRHRRAVHLRQFAFHDFPVDDNMSNWVTGPVLLFAPELRGKPVDADFLRRSRRYAKRTGRVLRVLERYAADFPVRRRQFVCR